MFEVLQSSLMQRALLAAVLIGFTNGFVSAFVVLHRSPLKLGALSHSIFPGIALIVVLLGVSGIAIYLGALAAAAAVGLGAIFFSRKSLVGEDTVLSVFMTGAFAVGILVLTRYEGAGGLESWLLGNIVGMSDSDLWVSYLVGGGAVLVLTFARRPIVALLFEPDIAATLGVRVHWLSYALFGLLILVLVTTLQAVGAILALGFIVTPAAAVRQLVDSVRALFWWSGVFGAVGAGFGFLGAVHWDLPIGAFMVVMFTVMFLVAIGVRALKLRLAGPSHDHAKST